MDIGEDFTLVGDREGSNGAVKIHQDVKMLVAKPSEGKQISYRFDKERGGFLQLARGQATLNGEKLKEGDGAEIINVSEITIKADVDSEIILFDMT